jgi:hypothetical protein
MDPQALRYDLNGSYGLDLREALTENALETALAEKVNAMINGDFSALVQILYRIDVSEPRLRQLLRENKTKDAGQLIARMILERQWQKILTRREFSRGDAAQGAGGGAGQGTGGEADQGAPDDAERW